MVKKLDFNTIIKFLKNKEEKKISLNDLRVNYKTLVRVKIHSMGYFLEEINAGTPIVNSDGILISVELMFTYINRGLMVELLDNVYMEDLYLLIMLSMEYNKDKPDIIKGQLEIPLQWVLKNINNEEYNNLVQINHPSIILEEDPETKLSRDSLEKINEFKEKFRKDVDENTIPGSIREKLLNKMKKSFVGKTLIERINPRTKEKEYVKIPSSTKLAEEYFKNKEKNENKEEIDLE